ncbi:helix-turn-helix domain-containing protein [Gracilibacillus sp. HCP3S3_G5_1]|uniref:helix-turn-helix domain-containing protein n=1 Tax=unclassified Gracilibacillus TaxID=2625209 RepID=UPI003F8AEF7D
MDIGKRIKNIRLAKGMKLTEVAKKAFISQPYLSDIENGRTTPSIDKLAAICEVLDTSLSEFFGVEKELSAETQRLIENVKQLTEEEVQSLGNFIEIMLKRESPVSKHKK